MSYPSPIFYKMGEGFPFACLPDFIKKCPLPVASATCFSLSARYNKNINAIGEKSRYCYEETSCAFAFALLGCRTVCRMRKHAHPRRRRQHHNHPRGTRYRSLSMAGSADELTPKMLQGELDILAVPVNLGSVLYNNSDGAVQLLAVNTLGVIYLVEKGGQTVTDWNSLKGQTIYATGKGSTPEYALNYLLEENGLDPAADVTIEWKSEPSEIVAQMAAEDHVIAMLPQPFVTVAQSKFDDLTIRLDLTKEWDALDNGSQLNTAGLVVRTEFAKEHPEAVAAFLKEYAASTQYVNENVSEAAQLVAQYDIVEAAVAEKAIPYCNIVCITGEEMKSSVQGYFQVLFDQNPQSVGGALPGDDFYYLGQ